MVDLNMNESGLLSSEVAQESEDQFILKSPAEKKLMDLQADEFDPIGSLLEGVGTQEGLNVETGEEFMNVSAL